MALRESLAPDAREIEIVLVVFPPLDRRGVVGALRARGIGVHPDPAAQEEAEDSQDLEADPVLEAEAAALQLR